jgi:NAD+ kinase
MESLPCSVPQRVGIVPKKTSAEASETSLHVERFLRAKGVDVLRDEEAVGRDSDLVVVLGGDGTLIHAAHLLGGRAVPILGINMGSLGFMTEVPQSSMYPALEQVLAGKSLVSPRMKLRIHLHRGGRDGKPELDAEVLNDAVISKGALSPMAELDTSYGDDYLTTYKADGVIINPICPHTLTQRPIVVPEDRSINVVLLNDAKVYLSLDGQTGVPLSRGDRVQVKQSQNRVLLVRNPDFHFFGILRAKLRWGER